MPPADALASRLAQVAAQRVRAGALLVLIGLAGALLVTGPLGLPLPPIVWVGNLLASAIALGLYLTARAGRLTLGTAHVALATVCLVAPLNTICTELVTGTPALAAPLMIAVLSISLQLDSRWCAASLAVVLAAWIPVHLRGLTTTDTVDVASVSATAILSFAFHLIGRRYVVAAETELEERRRAESEREAMRENFIHAQRMEAVGTLAAGLAHDMNNILAGILNISELLLEDAKEPKMRADLQDICREATRGAALTHNLLAFSRRGQYRHEQIALDDLVDQVVPMLRRTLPKAVTVQRRGASRAATEGDAAQLVQVLINLCVNATDAMSDAGTLGIETARVVLDEPTATRLGCKPGPHGMIAVTDTGAGMDDETRARIFEPFFTTKPIGKGTGLGLAMVYGAVQNHGGGIEVDSQLGRGTTFRVFLPDTAPIEEAEPRERQSTQPMARLPTNDPTRQASSPAIVVPGQPVVLIVDDEPLVRKAAARALTRAGLATVTAEHGGDAIDIVRARGSEISLVILDMSMPVMGGAECFTKLRELTDVPVLLATGYAVESEARDLLARGVAGFIDKPFTGSKLVEQVKRLLGIEAPPPPSA